MVRFGVAGYPLAFSNSSYNKDRMNIFEWINSLNLDAFEAQMTYGPKTSVENCKKIKSLSKDFNIKVSVHAAYYIVLTSKEKDKVRRSIETLKKTYELADLMGADIIVLHPGPLYGEDSKIVFNRLCENLELFFREIGNSHIGLFLETAGKKGQLGSVEEIIQLSNQFKGCFPCFDFGHIHARTGGSLNTPQSIDKLFNIFEKHDLFNPTKRIHFHYTPIDYGPKGEITHKAIDDKYPINNQLTFDFFDDKPKDNFYHPRFEHIIKKISKIDANFTIISETHNSQEIGAMEMKKLYNKIMK